MIEVARICPNPGRWLAAFDPISMDLARNVLPEITYCKNAYEAAAGADALAVVTEWNEFKYLSFERIASVMAGKHIFDGRNLYNPRKVSACGLIYYGVGCGRSAKADGHALNGAEGRTVRTDAHHDVVQCLAAYYF